MPKYRYTAKRGPTDIVNGSLEAESEEKAVSTIESMGLFPVKIVEDNNGPASTQVKGAETEKTVRAEPSRHAHQAGIPSRDMDQFIWQLASLIRSSVPILRALSLIARQTKNKNLKAIVDDLELQIKQGALLSEAMQKYPSVFNNMTVSMVTAGEKSGSLDAVLYKLAEYREKDQDLKRKIQSALAYPSIVIAAGIGTVFLMFTYFLPKLTKLFHGMKQELPVPTKILMAVSSFAANYWYVFILAAALLAVVIGMNKPGSRKKFMLDMFVLRIPIVNRFVRTAEIARFARSLGLLLKSGIPVFESLSLAANTLDNAALREKMAEASAAIIDQGCTVSESFKRAGVFPEFTINMVAVGEESGRLEESLAEVAASYEKEVDQTIKIMTTMIEPLLILIVGGFVGLIVFAMLLPILNMGLMGG